MSWRIHPNATKQGKPVFRFSNPETGEIREADSFAEFIEWHDELASICGDIAEALGPKVLKRWQDGDESLNLTAEVKELVKELRSTGADLDAILREQAAYREGRELGWAEARGEAPL